MKSDGERKLELNKFSKKGIFYWLTIILFAAGLIFPLLWFVGNNECRAVSRGGYVELIWGTRSDGIQLCKQQRYIQVGLRCKCPS